MRFPAEDRDVVGGVRHVQDDPVHRHHTPTVKPRASRARPGHGDRDPVEQHPQRLLAQPSTCLGDRTRGGYPPTLPPGAQEPQAVDQLAHHFLVAVVEEQTHRQHVVDDHPGGQQPGPLLPTPGLLDHLVHEVPVEQTGQDTDTDSIGEGTRDWHRFTVVATRSWSTGTTHSALNLAALGSMNAGG